MTDQCAIDRKGKFCPSLVMRQYKRKIQDFNVMKPEELRAAREEMGLTQIDAAKKYEVKHRTYKNYELGETPIPGPVKLLTAYFMRDHRNLASKS